MRVSETWEASRRSALPCLPNNSQGALWIHAVQGAWHLSLQDGIARFVSGLVKRSILQFLVDLENASQSTFS